MNTDLCMTRTQTDPPARPRHSLTARRPTEPTTDRRLARPRSPGATHDRLRTKRLTAFE